MQPKRHHHQLGFPWCGGDLRAVASYELAGASCVRIDVREGMNEVALALSVVSKHSRGDYWYAEDRFEVHLRLAHPVWCRVNGTRSNWDMERVGTPELPLAIPAAGPFAAAIEWALYQLEPSSRYAHRDEEAIAREAPWRVALLRAANRVADRALDMCDPRAHDRASRFDSDVRLFVYGALTSDPSPRTEQMIETCPGLLVLAADRHDADALEGIRRGRRLSPLINVVLPRGCADERAAVILVRRAVTEASPACLRAAIAAKGVDINDMPTETDARRCWYAAVAVCQHLQVRLPGRLDRQRFGSFVSKHAVELAAIADARWLDIEAVLTEILDWNIHGPGTVPSRRSSLPRVLEAVATWHAGLWAGPKVDPETRLPTGPMPSTNIDGISMVPMKTVGELAIEGAVMHHCVAGYADAAVDGHVFIYRATVRGQRATIAIAPQGDRWRLVDAAGVANRSIQAPDVLSRWVDALDRRTP